MANHFYTSATKPIVEPSARAPRSGNRIKRIRKVVVGIIMVILLVLIISLDRQPTINIDSQLYRNPAAYADGVSKALNGVNSLSKVTINRASVTANIKSRFPEVDQVKINMSIYSRKAKVSLKIAPPAFVLSGAPGTFGEKVRYIIAANGKIVGLTENYPKVKKDLPNLTNQSSYQIKLGDLVLGQGTSGFILTIYSQCLKNNIPIASFTLAKNSQEIDLRTKDKSYFVKFSLAGDAATQVGQFLAARSQLARSGEPGQYLDVRVDGRIYYK